MLVITANGEQPAVHDWVQRLQPTIHHFREAGVLGDVLHYQARLLEGLGRSSRGQDLDVELGQCRGELNQPGLVRD